MCYDYGPEWTWERWQWRGTPHSQRLQHCWNFTIRLFTVLSRTLMGGSYPSAAKQSVYSSAPADWAKGCLLIGNYTRILCTFWTNQRNRKKQKLYSYLPLISQTIQIRRASHAGHREKIKDDLINDVLVWTRIHGDINVSRPAKNLHSTTLYGHWMSSRGTRGITNSDD